MSALPPLLQAYFTERLARQRDASPHTIASYRDSFRLLLEFLHQQTGKAPSMLQLEDLDAATITAFLAHLENERGNSVRTRNAQRAADRDPLVLPVRGIESPECAELIARVLSIPEKRHESTLISYLTEPEIDALLAAPDRFTPTGRRDPLLLVAVQTGLRASELASLRCQDLNLASGWVRCVGKGRKERCTPPQPRRQAGTPRVATRTRRRPRRPAVPQPQRRAPHPQRDLAPRRQAHHHRTGAMPVTGSQQHHPAHAAPHRRDATAARPNPGSTPQRSPYGSGTRHSTPPTNTCTPTWNSNDARWTAPRPPTPNPDATDRPTRCSPSSRASDQPEICCAQQPDPQISPRRRGSAQHSSGRNIGEDMLRATYPGARTVTHQAHELVGVMAGRLDGEVGAGSSPVPAG
jgi:integrase/recombinase XerD